MDDLREKCDDTDNATTALRACKAVLNSPDADNDDRKNAWDNLTELYALDNKLNDAMNAVDESLRIDQHDCSVLMHRGTLQFLLGNAGQAISDLTRANSETTNGFCGMATAEPLSSRGDIFFSLGNYSRAAADYEQALKGSHLASRHLPTMLFLAERHLGQENNEKLQSNLARLISTKTTAAFVGWTDFDTALENTLLGNLDREALLSLAPSNKADENGGRFGKAFFILGEMEFFRGDYTSSRADFEQAQRFDPTNWGLFAKTELGKLPPATFRSTSVADVVFRPAAPMGRYYALVIGISNYAGTLHLDTPTDDAKAVAAILSTRYGFEVRTLLDADATRANILTAIRVYRTKLQPKDNLLIYYAGHGFSDKAANKAYWLPIDADSEDSSNVIISDDITASVRAQQADHVLVIADSCYSGDLTRDTAFPVSVQETSDYLDNMRARRSRTLMASGGDEPVSDHGGNGHSIFAASLIKALDTASAPAFTAGRLFYDRIQQSVGGQAHQLPQYDFLRDSGHDSGDFVFVRTSAAP